MVLNFKKIDIEDNDGSLYSLDYMFRECVYLNTYAVYMCRVKEYIVFLYGDVFGGWNWAIWHFDRRIANNIARTDRGLAEEMLKDELMEIL